MAIYHCEIKNISRRDGKNIIASAAYRSGEKLTDENGTVFDYSRKEKVVANGILLPENCPSRFSDRETLWKEVNANEKRKDALLAKELEVAFPIELNQKQCEELLKNFLEENLLSRGIICDFAFHDKKGNPHAHILLTTRFVNKDGFGKKNREMVSKDFLKDIRKAWENCTNKFLEQAGIDERVDCRSYKDRGLFELPSIYEGWKARRMERQGLKSDRCEINRKRRYWNFALKKHREEGREIDKEGEKLSKAVEAVLDKVWNVLGKAKPSALSKPPKQMAPPIRDAWTKLLKLAKAGDEAAMSTLGYFFPRTQQDGLEKDWLLMSEMEKDAIRNRVGGEDMY